RADVLLSVSASRRLHLRKLLLGSRYQLIELFLRRARIERVGRHSGAVAGRLRPPGRDEGDGRVEDDDVPLRTLLSREDLPGDGRIGGRIAAREIGRRGGGDADGRGSDRDL